MASPVQARLTPPPAGRVTATRAGIAALLLANTFAGGSNGATLTQGSGGNTGGTSGNFFDSVTIGGSATLAFDTTHFTSGSGLAAKVATGVSSANSYVAWTTQAGDQPRVWFRQYLYFTANPAGNFRVFSALGGSASLAGALQVLSGGTLRWLNAAGSTILTTTATIPLNTWFRVEGFITGSPNNGQVGVSLYWPADAQTPVETDTSAAAQSTLGPINAARFGVTSAVANVAAFWMGGLGLSNTGPLGPVNLTAAPSHGQPAMARIPPLAQRRGAGEIYRTPPRIPVTLLNTFDGGTSGVTASAGNSGGASGNAFDSVTTGAGGTIAYSSAQAYTGTLSLLCQTTTANASGATWQASTRPLLGQVWFRVYLFFPASPSGNTRYFTANGAAAGAGRFVITAAGKLLVQNGAGATVTTSTATIPIGAWFRVEGYTLGSATLGATEVKLFYPANATTALETNTGTSVNTLGMLTGVTFGPNSALVNQGPYYMDAIAVSNTGYLGPISLTAPLYPWTAPVTARRPPLSPRSRGQVAQNPGAPVQNPTSGPVTYPLQGPVRARVPQLAPAAGRVTSSPGAPLANPLRGPVFRQATSPCRAPYPPLHPRAGRTSGNPGVPPIQQGPPFRQATQPCRSPLPPPHPRAGRTSGNPGTPPIQQGPPFRQATAPCQSRYPALHPRAGRATGSRGAPLFIATAGPVFRQAVQPAQARRPLPPRGRCTGGRGAPYVPPILAPGVVAITNPSPLLVAITAPSPAVVAVAPTGGGAAKVRITVA